MSLLGQFSGTATRDVTTVTEPTRTPLSPVYRNVGQYGITAVKPYNHVSCVLALVLLVHLEHLECRMMNVASCTRVASVRT